MSRKEIISSYTSNSLIHAMIIRIKQDNGLAFINTTISFIVYLVKIYSQGGHSIWKSKYAFIQTTIPLSAGIFFLKDAQLIPPFLVYTDESMLVIHRKADDVAPHADIKAFCSSHPTMQLAVIPGADHRFKRPGDLQKVVELSKAFWSTY